MKYSYDNLEMTVTYRKDKEIEIRVANHNTFRVGNITVTTEYAGKKRTEFIGRIEAHETEGYFLYDLHSSMFHAPRSSQ